MIITKRSLYITIALLAAIDVAAGLWYLTGHINSDGKLQSMLDGTTNAVQADTVSSGNGMDEFMTMSDNAYYVSKEPVVEDDADSYYTCVKRFKGRIPRIVNGNAALTDLIAQISYKAFGEQNAQVDVGIKKFLDTPAWSTDATVDFKSIGKAPKIVKGYGHVEGVKVYPALASRNWLVMVVDKTVYDGRVTHEQLRFVTYDRTRNRVLDNSEVIANSGTDKVLAAINAKLEKEGLDGLHMVTQLPGEMYLSRDGIHFVWASGEVAAEHEGVVKAFVPYKTLRPSLTPAFATLLDSNGKFKNFEPLSFKK